MFLPEPETRDRPPELRAGVRLPGHRIPCVAWGHRVATDGGSAPPFPRWTGRKGAAGGGAHAVVARPRGRRAIASGGAAWRAYRRGLDPSLRPRAANGPLIPSVPPGSWGARD